MSDTYTYNPDAWHPAVAGIAAGSIAGIISSVVSMPLRSPDEVAANSLTVVLMSLLLGLVAGMLWRRLRATANARRTFGWAMAGGFLVAMMAIAVADQTVLSNLIAYATPIAALIFITLGFLTPLFAGVTASPWLVTIPVVIALGLGIGLFGRGNVASGELTLDDIETTSTTSGAAGDEGVSGAASEPPTTTSSLSGALDIPDDLAAEYNVAGGLATYSVEEELQGLPTVGVGTTESITGSIAPGGAFDFTIDLQSFVSDQSRRDAKVREWFSQNPDGTFSGESFDLPSSAQVGEAVAFEVTGDLTVNGITHASTWAIEARVEENATLSVTGETFIVLSEFDIPVLDGGLIVMEDGATIEVAFSAAP